MKLCEICTLEESKYSCPKCNLKYCSLKCYKHQKHLTCVEMFAQTQVVDAMKGMTASPVERERVKSLLLKYQYIDDSSLLAEEEPNLDDLQERFKDIDFELDSIPKIKSKLTKEELEKFNQIIKNNPLLLLDEWLPWWSKDADFTFALVTDSNNSPKDPLDQEQVGTDPNKDSFLHKLQSKYQSIPKFKPSLKLDLKFNLLELLSLYILIQHSMYGAIFEDPHESTALFLKHSNVLKISDFLYHNAEELDSHLLPVAETYGPRSYEVVQTDIEKFMGNRDFCVRVLVEIGMLFKSVKKWRIEQKMFFYVRCLDYRLLEI